MKTKVKEYIKKNHRASPKINKLTDAQRLLARYIQLFEKDEISESKLRALSYSCKVFADISRIDVYIKEMTDIIERIEAIEKVQNEKRN